MLQCAELADQAVDQCSARESSPIPNDLYVPGDAQALISLPLSAINGPEPLSHFVRLAAKTVHAESAFLLVSVEGKLEVLQSFGLREWVALAPLELVRRCSQAIGEGTRNPVAVQTASDGSFQATVAIERGGRFLGVLGIYDSHAGTLNTSQEYVLEAIAFEIANDLELRAEGESPEHKSPEAIDLIARLRLLESVVVNANDSILITEAEPVHVPGPIILYANPAFTRMTGYTCEEVLGKSPRILQGPLSGREGPDKIRAALKAWEPIELELLNYRKDGTTFWVELSISPVCDERGWFTHWVSVQRDVTERRLLHAQMGDSVASARVLFVGQDPNMRDYVAVSLGQGFRIAVVRDANEALLAMEGSLPNLVLCDVASLDGAELNGFGADGFELLRTLRASSRTAALPFIMLSGDEGEEARAQAMESGVSDYLPKPFSPLQLKTRVRMQLELQALRRDVLEKQELIRTNEALRHSEKLAVVGRLASSIAHEINNPLEAMSNLLYLAEATLGSSEAGDYVRQAQAELVRIANITTQTLRFHRQSTKARQTSMAEVLDGVMTLFNGRPLGAGLVIGRRYRGTRSIMAFEADLRQVFANLISNAMDASAAGGGIMLRVREALDTRTGEQGVRVIVADDGHMSSETRKRIFEAFFTTKGMTGTGLGLRVSCEILENHKARVSVRSSQNPLRHGTVFSIFFPMAGAIAR